MSACQDAYKSLNEALIHGGLANRVKVNIHWIDAELFEQPDSDIAARLEPMHAILVPGAFGVARRGGQDRLDPFRPRAPRALFRHLLRHADGLRRGHAEYGRRAEAAPPSSARRAEPVVGLITEWMSKEGLQKREAGGDLGGTMRLGAYQANLSPTAMSRRSTAANTLSERHRHRWEVNMGYKDRLENTGLIFSGMSPDGTLPEIVERPDHPWFVGVQFHPELKSKPFDPHPLFASFIEAAVKQSRLVAQFQQKCAAVLRPGCVKTKR